MEVAPLGTLIEIGTLSEIGAHGTLTEIGALTAYLLAALMHGYSYLGSDLEFSLNVCQRSSPNLVK